MAHKFEEAGLGKAPFRVVGFVCREGPIQLPDGSTIGAPGQPMGTCNFCGRGIKVCCQIKSADGNQAEVGTTCVQKTGDAGLRKVVRGHLRRADHARADARISKCVGLLEDERVLGLLCREPHPNKYQAERGRTLRDWATWMIKNAGRAGKIKVCRRVEKVVSEMEG